MTAIIVVNLGLWNFDDVTTNNKVFIWQSVEGRQKLSISIGIYRLRLTPLLAVSSSEFRSSDKHMHSHCGRHGCPDASKLFGLCK